MKYFASFGVTCAAIAMAGCALLGGIDPVQLADAGYHKYCDTDGKSNPYCSKSNQALEAQAFQAGEDAESVIAEAKANGSWTQALQDHETAILEDALALITDFEAGHAHHKKGTP